MISSFFISAGSLFFGLLIAALPESTALPSGITSAFSTVVEAINGLSYLIPVSSLFTALGIVVAYEAAVWLFFAGMWIWKRIPFIGR